MRGEFAVVIMPNVLSFMLSPALAAGVRSFYPLNSVVR
jgi:hypothetical protein